MEDYYKVLGVNSSATMEELRRAYRILARRYHPDVNPGRASEDRFKLIAQAYTVLSDPAQRKIYDVDYDVIRRRTSDARVEAYRRQQEDQFRARSRYYAEKAKEQQAKSTASRRPQPRTAPEKNFGAALRKASSTAKRILGSLTPGAKQQRTDPTSHGVARVSILEVSVGMRDAIFGVRKTVEIAEPEGTRKVSVRIPPGVRTGSVVRLRGKTPPIEEIVMIVRVAAHPFLSMQAKGLVAEIPISVQEAICGASISVPGIEGALVIKIPAGTQSGAEIRVRDKGVADRDGKRGEIFYRMLIRVPESSDAVGIRDQVAALEKYYGAQIRRELPARLMELERS